MKIVKNKITKVLFIAFLCISAHQSTYAWTSWLPFFPAKNSKKTNISDNANATTYQKKENSLLTWRNAKIAGAVLGTVTLGVLAYYYLNNNPHVNDKVTNYLSSRLKPGLQSGWNYISSFWKQDRGSEPYESYNLLENTKKMINETNYLSRWYNKIGKNLEQAYQKIHESSKSTNHKEFMQKIDTVLPSAEKLREIRERVENLKSQYNDLSSNLRSLKTKYGII